jgi:outer membrane protein assembly factor BamD
MKRRFVKYAFFCAVALALPAACGKEKLAADLTVDQLRESGLAKLDQGKEPAAREYFEHMITRSPTAAPEALYYIALSYHEQGLYEEAYVRFEQIIDRYPASEWCDDAQYMKGMTKLAAVLPIEKDQTAIDEALDEFTTLIEEYENSPLIPKAREGIAEVRRIQADKFLAIGKFYKKTGEYRAAVVYFENLGAAYPEYSGSAEAAFLSGECYGELGELDAAASSYRNVLSRYPESPFAEAAATRLSALGG